MDMKRKYCLQKYIFNLRRQHSYIVSQTDNADQTPVYFEMPLDTTVHKKGDKNVTIRIVATKNSGVQYVVHYGGRQKIAAVYHLEKEDCQK
jgi:hypothetical protein